MPIPDDSRILNQIGALLGALLGLSESSASRRAGTIQFSGQPCLGALLGGMMYLMFGSYRYGFFEEESTKRREEEWFGCGFFGRSSATDLVVRILVRF